VPGLVGDVGLTGAEKGVGPELGLRLLLDAVIERGVTIGDEGLLGKAM